MNRAIFPVALGGAFGLVLGSPFVAVPVPAAVLLGVMLWRRHRARAVLRDADQAVIEWVDRIGQRLRSGGSLAGVLGDELVDLADPAKGGDPELRARFAPTRAALAAGQGLGPALARVDHRGIDSLGLFCAALSVLLTEGGPAVPALDRLGDTLRDVAGVRRESRSQASQASASALVLAALPVVFALIVATLEPAAAHFYLFTWFGAVCVVLAGAFTALGWVWIDRLVVR